MSVEATVWIINEYMKTVGPSEVQEVNKPAEDRALASDCGRSAHVLYVEVILS